MPICDYSTHELRERLLKQVMENLHDEPFRYASIPEVLPWDLYWELNEKFPRGEQVVVSSIRRDEPMQNMNFQWHYGQDPDVAQEWREFMAMATDGKFYRALCDATVLPERYRGLHPEGVRYRDKEARLQHDCFFSVNTPVDQESSVKGPHLDNPRELFAFLIYFPEPGDTAGGNLGLYRRRAGARFYGKQMCDEVDLWDVVPYEHNRGIFFVNGPDALHGVTRRYPTRHYRRYVNIEAEWCKPLFEVQ